MGSAVIRDNFAKMTPENRDEVVEKTKQEVLEMLKQTIRPEFLNRIDETIMFTPLNESEIEDIVRLQIESITRLLKESDVTLESDESAIKYIAKAGFDPEFGARPIKRAIQRYLLNDLSKQLLAGSIDKSRPIKISSDGNMLVFTNR